MSLQLHNTLTRRKEAFEPIDPANVRMYVCGPTVYQRIHIGNARPLIVFDVLFRLLRHVYGEKHVTYVRNITDIDDKIIDQAARNGEPIEALTRRTTEAFLADADALGCKRPTFQPRATEHIDGMVALIETLILQGHAYASHGHVLFNVPSMPAYGRLSGRNRDDQIDGARVEVAPYKKDPADFVLWKPSSAEQPGWESPWGRGRPGWHIECSAMAGTLLGVPFDIHGGGLDLIFPHHENEIAQSCCAHHLDRMANVWMHNGFVDMGGEKMSKSLGNVLRLDEALERWPAEAIRYWMLSAHYRQPIDLSERALEEATASLDRLYNALRETGDGPARDAAGAPTAAVLEALSDDLNTPRALAALHASASAAFQETAQERRLEHAAALRRDGRLLGLLQRDPRDWKGDGEAAGELGAAEIEALIGERNAARKARDFARADQVRQQLAARGVVLKDTPAGTTWHRA